MEQHHSTSPQARTSATEKSKAVERSAKLMPTKAWRLEAASSKRTTKFREESAAGSTTRCSCPLGTGQTPNTSPLHRQWESRGGIGPTRDAGAGAHARIKLPCLTYVRGGVLQSDLKGLPSRHDTAAGGEDLVVHAPLARPVPTRSGSGRDLVHIEFPTYKQDPVHVVHAVESACGSGELPCGSLPNDDPCEHKMWAQVCHTPGS